MRIFWKNLPLVVMQRITKTRRYRPEILWSQKSWTHNIFRSYEYVFGRAEGIRRESSVAVITEHGRYVEYIQVFTFEACCAYIETYIRAFLQRNFLPLRLITVNFIRVDGTHIQMPWMTFAIAFDASAVGTTTATSPITGTHTCTGSNLMLAVGSGNTATSPTISTPTYSSVSMSLVGAQQTNVANMAAMYFLVAPATGANTVSIAFGGTTPDCNYNSVSYSGVKQSGQPDASGGNTGAGSPN